MSVNDNDNTQLLNNKIYSKHEGWIVETAITAEYSCLDWRI